jgi:hypothetical protein
MFVPIIGTADTKLVITVAAQKLIWPHGKTYPINAAAIINKNISIPLVHTIGIIIYD